MDEQQSRRRFLTGSAAAAGGLAFTTLGARCPPPDPPPPPPPTTTTTTVAPPTGWRIAWEDSFAGGTLDLNKWHYDHVQFGTGNNVDNVNLPENVFLRNRACVIKAHRQNYVAGGKTYTWTAGSIQSNSAFPFRKGQILEAKFRTSTMQSGMWPALWTSSPSPGDDSEIDMVELFGNAKSAHVGIFWDYSPTQKDQREFAYNSLDWHYWRCEWDTTTRFYLDNQLMYTVGATNTARMTNNPQLVRITIQIGGTWGGPIDPAFNYAEIETEYVRVWERA